VNEAGEEQLVVITANLDGLGCDKSYRGQSAAVRAGKILELIMLSLGGPEEAARKGCILLFQEVVAQAHEVIKKALPSWSVFARKKRFSDYYVLSMVSPALNSSSLRATSQQFAGSQQGRHAVTVYFGNWSVTNAHAESHDHFHPEQSKESRASQFEAMARPRDDDHFVCQIVAGDLNMRDGEDGEFRTQGWKEPRQEAVNWTYKDLLHQFSARYDRVFYRSSHDASFMPIKMSAVEGVWKYYSDHRPISDTRLHYSVV
jgi:hypothetical protein